jgi:hypothetical protein
VLVSIWPPNQLGQSNLIWYLKTEGINARQKVDFKKGYKDLCLPKTKPMLIHAQQMSFIMMDGIFLALDLYAAS